MDIGSLYAQHHAEKGRMGFSILEDARAQWFLKQIKKTFGDTQITLLDLGCRDATLTSHFVSVSSKIVGADVDLNALAAAKQKIPTGTFLTMDLLEDWNELAGETFDVILCSEVLEHLYYPDRVCEKIGKALSPGGLFIGSVPNALFLKHRLRYLFGNRTHTPLEDPTHITQFNEAHLRTVLSRAGDQIVIEGYTRPPFTELARVMPGFFGFDFLFRTQ